jgi:hypothetical protein
MVALITVIWLLTMKAPAVAPPIMASSQGSAFRMGPMLPPWAMNTPNTQPSTTTHMAWLPMTRRAGRHGTGTACTIGTGPATLSAAHPDDEHG